MTILNKVNDWLWRPKAQFRFVRYILQIIVRLVERVIEDDFRERSQALAFTTLLSIVPLLAVSFSVLKSFGAHHELTPLLLKVFDVLGDDAPEMSNTLIQFVENVQVGVLGGVGLAVLFYTVVSLISTIESSFNRIWGVKIGRDLTKRIAYYLVVVLIGPVLAFAVLSLFSSAIMAKIFGFTLPFGLDVVLNKTFTVGVLTLIIASSYLFITYKTVRIIPALIGGFAAAFSWYCLGQVFGMFVASSAKYSGIYSGFAGVILFLLWMQFNWLIILLGSQLAYFIQHPERLKAPITYADMPSKVTLMVTLEAKDKHDNEWTVSEINTIQQKKNRGSIDNG